MCVRWKQDLGVSLSLLWNGFPSHCDCDCFNKRLFVSKKLCFHWTLYCHTNTHFHPPYGPYWLSSIGSLSHSQLTPEGREQWTGNLLISPPSSCLFTPFFAKTFHILIDSYASHALQLLLIDFYGSIKLTNNLWSLFNFSPFHFFFFFYIFWNSNAAFTSPSSYLSLFLSSLFSPPPTPFLSFIFVPGG